MVAKRGEWPLEQSLAERALAQEWDTRGDACARVVALGMTRRGSAQMPGGTTGALAATLHSSLKSTADLWEPLGGRPEDFGRTKGLQRSGAWHNSRPEESQTSLCHHV